MELFTPLIFSILMLLMPQQTINPGSVTIVGNATAANQTNASQKTQIVDGSGNVIGATSNKLDVNCASGCSGGTTDTDDGTVAGGQSTGLQIGEVYMWNGSAWVRLLGDATNGLKVNLAATAANSTAIKVDGSAVTQPVSGTVTVTDGAGALNVIVDSGTTAVTQSTATSLKGVICDGAGNSRCANVDANNNLGVQSPLITYNATQPTKTDGQTSDVQITSRGALIVNPGTESFPVADGGGSLTVDAPVGTPVFVRLSDGSAAITTLPVSLASVPSHAVTNAGTFAVQAAATIADAADVTLGAKADAKSTATDTTSVTVMQVIKEISAMEQAPASRAVTNAGTFAVQSTGTTAVGSTYSGNPVNLACKSVNAEQTATTNGQEQALVCDLVGKAIVMPYANPENFVQGVTAAITDTTSTSVIASAGGSLRNYITHCTISNSHATVGTFVKILDGSTIIDEVYAAAAGGGGSLTYPVPLRGTAATAINAQPVTTGTNVIVACNGFKGL